MDRVRLGVVVAAGIAVVGLTAATWSPGSAASSAPSAKALESSLLAPCCWGGTLDTHDSPLAGELRSEIEARAGAGEPTAAIEADLVGRYGARMRAMPRVGAFTNALVVALDALIVAIAALALMLRRWRVRQREADGARAAAPEPARDAYDDRIDAELADV